MRPLEAGDKDGSNPPDSRGKSQEGQSFRWLSVNSAVTRRHSSGASAACLSDEGLIMSNLGWCPDRKRQHTLGDFRLDYKRGYHICEFCGDKLRDHG